MTLLEFTSLFKRYFATENNKIKGILYLPYAFLHAVAFNLRYRGINGLLSTLRHTCSFIFVCI